MLIGSLGVFVFLLLVFLGMPIAVSLIVASVGGLIGLAGWDSTVGMLGPMLFKNAGPYGFSVIPLFILMGNIGFNSGLLTEVFEVARKWLGRLPGGLAISVVGANTVFAACSGSSVAACTVIGRASLPIMKRAGYPIALSVGVVTVAGTLATLIPPSINICLYGLLVDESIGKLLIAGVFPGLLTASVYVVYILLTSRKLPIDAEKTSWLSKFKAIRQLWVVVAIIVGIIVSIYTGICTPTEAASVGTSLVFIMAVATRKMNWNILWLSLKQTVTTSGMILVIIVAALLFARLLSLSYLSRTFVGSVANLEAPRIVIFLIVTCIYFVLGCFIGAAGMMVITLPVIYPLMLSLGYDSIWFGIIVVKYCELALVTPPVAANLYAVKAIAPDVPMTTIIRGTVPFLAMEFVTIAILYMFPSIVTFLPSLMTGSPK